MKKYISIKENVSQQIVEKKSKFIANIIYVNNKEEAHEKLEEIKSKYFDSRHNCFAYRVLENDTIIERMSDDGEPSGTAGMPMLNILSKRNLVNVIAVVTRYFGGILLGTGGLAHAYSESTIKALDSANFVSLEQGLELEVKIAYPDLSTFQYYCKKNEIEITNIIYENDIKCILEIKQETLDELLNSNESSNFKLIETQILSKKLIRKNIEK